MDDAGAAAGEPRQIARITRRVAAVAADEDRVRDQQVRAEQAGLLKQSSEDFPYHFCSEAELLQALQAVQPHLQPEALRAPRRCARISAGVRVSIRAREEGAADQSVVGAVEGLSTKRTASARPASPSGSFQRTSRLPSPRVTLTPER